MINGVIEEALAFAEPSLLKPNQFKAFFHKGLQIWD